MPSITATCVTRALRQRTRADATPSGIDKAAVGAVVLGETGVEGDSVLDTDHHGGVDKAVYAYADEDAAWWAERLGEPVEPGTFGENLRTEGIDLGAQVIGTRLRVGATVELEVSEPRVPCGTFAHRMGDRPGWVKEFTAANRTGTYLRVLSPGGVSAGDEVTVTHVPDHGVTIAGWFGANDPGDARRLLLVDGQDGWRLPSALRGYCEWVLSRA